VNGDVVDRHAVVVAFERTVVRVTVHDEIGTMPANRTREPVGAQDEPQALGLSDERRLDRRVVEERDLDPAALDRSQTLLEAVDVAGRLGVRLAEQRLAEVRPLLPEAADEALDAGDPDAHPAHGQDRVRAVEHDDARLRERAPEVVRAVRLPVVVPEHGDDGTLERPARIGDDADLVDLAVLGEVAGEQHQIGLGGDVLERFAHAVAVGRAGMDVACRSNANRRHAFFLPGIDRCTPREPDPPVSQDEQFDQILNAMKVAAATLRDAGIPFALAGGLAVYARGGPPTEHDVDFLIRQEDADRAVELLGDAGFRSEHPPEGWLYKVYDENDSMIDLIFAPNSRPERVQSILDRATELEVYAITMPVMTATDVLESKLRTLKEHEANYDDVLEIARTCREQIDWEAVRTHVGDSPYAKAFFTLVDELNLTA
jgi:hypothetical protein